MNIVELAGAAPVVAVAQVVGVVGVSHGGSAGGSRCSGTGSSKRCMSSKPSHLRVKGHLGPGHTQDQDLPVSLGTITRDCRL